VTPTSLACSPTAVAVVGSTSSCSGPAFRSSAAAGSRAAAETGNVSAGAALALGR